MAKRYYGRKQKQKARAEIERLNKVIDIADYAIKKLQGDVLQKLQDDLSFAKHSLNRLISKIEHIQKYSALLPPKAKDDLAGEYICIHPSLSMFTAVTNEADCIEEIRLKMNKLVVFIQDHPDQFCKSVHFICSKNGHFAYRFSDQAFLYNPYPIDMIKDIVAVLLEQLKGAYGKAAERYK